MTHFIAVRVKGSNANNSMCCEVENITIYIFLGPKLFIPRIPDGAKARQGRQWPLKNFKKKPCSFFFPFFWPLFILAVQHCLFYTLCPSGPYFLISSLPDMTSHIEVGPIERGIPISSMALSEIAIFNSLYV